MDSQNALQIIKNIINAGIKTGLFQSMEDAGTALVAYRYIEEKLITEDNKSTEQKNT